MFSSSVLVFGILIAGVISIEVILTPKTVDVKENESVVLTVNYTGTYTLRSCRKNNESWCFIILYENGSCGAIGFILNSSLYKLNCHGNTSFSITIIKVEKEQHGDRWLCRSGISTLSNEVTINVKVPVKNVHITTNESTIILKESEYKTFTCNTSYSRPMPSVKWFIKVAEKTLHLNSTETDNLYKDENGFESAQNVLNVSFNRDKNGAELFCYGGNGIGEVQSNHVVMNITFSPSNPTFRYIDVSPKVMLVTDNVINVIEEDEFYLICQSVGNPPPEYRWENGETGNTSNVTAEKSLNKTCTATNTFGESRTRSTSSTLFVNVLSSPTMPQINVYIRNTTIQGNVSDYIRVIEKESLNVSCTSKGNPLPIYKWYMNSSEISTHEELVRMNISRQQSGIYTCKASNTMIRTFGETKVGSSISNLTVDVIYPAEVGDLTDLTVLEGSSINITCPVIVGNPPEATVKWTPGGDLGSSDSTSLYISNITRDDEKLYNCSVTTLMSPTYGSHKEETNYGKLQLTVNYKARLTEFFIGVETNKDDYTVNEAEDVTFTCNIDGKPAPNATLLFNDRVIHISNSRNLTYRRGNIKCEGFGVYKCLGINEYNYGRSSAKTLTLYVSCSPRPSPFNELKTNVTSARNTKATFSFTALAYPEPGPSGFIWSFMNGSDRITLSNSSNVFISNTKIQSSLTIRNVIQEDYRQYILRIRNAIGVFEQTFFLNPKATFEGPQQIVVFSNIEAFIGVGVSTFLVTLMVVAIVLVLYRRFRLRSNQSGKADNDVPDRFTREEDDNSKHEYIQMSTDDVNRRPNAEQETRTKVNFISSVYERIACDQTERNPYSPLQTAYQQLDSVSKEQNTYSTIRKQTP